MVWKQSIQQNRCKTFCNSKCIFFFCKLTNYTTTIRIFFLITDTKNIRCSVKWNHLLLQRSPKSGCNDNAENEPRPRWSVPPHTAGGCWLLTPDNAPPEHLWQVAAVPALTDVPDVTWQTQPASWLNLLNNVCFTTHPYKQVCWHSRTWLYFISNRNSAWVCPSNIFSPLGFRRSVLT